MKNIYIYALRDRKTGNLTALTTNYIDDSTIVEFYLNILKSSKLNKGVIYDYDICKLGYYDIVKKEFVTEDLVIQSLTTNILPIEEEVQEDE